MDPNPKLGADVAQALAQVWELINSFPPVFNTFLAFCVGVTVSLWFIRQINRLLIDLFKYEFLEWDSRKSKDDEEKPKRKNDELQFDDTHYIAGFSYEDKDGELVEFFFDEEGKQIDGTR